MAKLHISICDYCKEISKQPLDYTLTIRKKKEGNLVRIEICNKCFGIFASKTKEDVNLDKIQQKDFSLPVAEDSQAIKIDEDVSLVPSKMSYGKSSGQKQSSGCPHDRTSFDPPKIKCKDCGESWSSE